MMQRSREHVPKSGGSIEKVLWVGMEEIPTENRRKMWRFSKTGESISSTGSWCRHRHLTKPPSTLSFMWEWIKMNEIYVPGTHTHWFITVVPAGSRHWKKPTTVVFIEIMALARLKVSLWFTENVTKRNDHMQAPDNKHTDLCYFLHFWHSFLFLAICCFLYVKKMDLSCTKIPQTEH